VSFKKCVLVIHKNGISAPS